MASRRRRGGRRNPLGPDGLRERTLWSNFLITINPNVAHGTRGGLATRFRDDVEELFGSLANIERFVEFNRGAENTDARFATPWVHDIEATFVIEQGDRFRRMHAHVLLRVKHRSSIRIAPKEIQRWFKERRGPDTLQLYKTNDPAKNVYVNISSIRGHGNVLRYMAKGIAEFDSQPPEGLIPDTVVREIGVRGGVTAAELGV